MTFPPPWQASLEAYLKLLESKGADPDNLTRRRELLEGLLSVLPEAPLSGEKFRRAIDEALARIAKNDWPFFLTIARDFYPFLSNDYKTIATLHRTGSFAVAPDLPDTPAAPLQDLWEQLKVEKFSVLEKWPVNAYRAGLLNHGLTREAVEIRTRLAQLQELQLRQVKGMNGHVYRLAAESMLPVFHNPATARLFIGVVREFFHFWLGDPNATDRIATDHDDDHYTLW
jgi:hypothetical protein